MIIIIVMIIITILMIMMTIILSSKMKLAWFIDGLRAKACFEHVSSIAGERAGT